MEKKCEHLEQCGFFNKFKGNSEVTKNNWIKLFCESEEKSVNCKRKQYKKHAGEMPADNMSPTGKMIS